VLLLKVGQSDAGRARFIDAASLVNYPSANGTPSPGGPCAVPVSSEKIFNTELQTCLDKQGYLLGRRDKIPWQTGLGGHMTTRRAARQEAAPRR
jgi:hypothetical protein